MQQIDLTEAVRMETVGHSSKGNQPKWQAEDYWYKADHMGYEALAEVLVSRLLAYSNIQNYVSYDPILIRIGNRTLNGCRSRSFQGEKESLIPLERLYRAYRGESLAKKLAELSSPEEQISFVVDFAEDATELTGFGQYLNTLLELDAFILNEDRHTNNIAVLRNEETGAFRLCPIFDNGLSFLSDITDYPFHGDLFEQIQRVEAKPFSRDFMEQLEAGTSLYGSQLHFHFSRGEIAEILDELTEYYPEETRSRVEKVLREQMRKFQYMF